MNKDYVGTIIEESLEDNRILNEIEITNFRISKNENPLDRWHLCKVKVSKEDIEMFSKCIKAGKWYMHFWKEADVIVIFRGKTFEFNYTDKTTWKDAIDYGRSVGIPDEQLDFKID